MYFVVVFYCKKSDNYFRCDDNCAKVHIFYQKAFKTVLLFQNETLLAILMPDDIKEKI